MKKRELETGREPNKGIHRPTPGELLKIQGRGGQNRSFRAII
jgi:hypothetical protein